jgi:hypothetical protein
LLYRTAKARIKIMNGDHGRFHMKYALPAAIVMMMVLPLITKAEVPNKPIAREKILSEGPEWQVRYDAFKPDPDLISETKAKLGNDLRIDVYLGLWCPDSRNNVPPFLKLLDELGAPVNVQYFAVQRKPSSSIKYYVDSVLVERVPTFIFYRGDKEIGRIIENPKTGLLEDMRQIITK